MSLSRRLSLLFVALLAAWIFGVRDASAQDAPSREEIVRGVRAALQRSSRGAPLAAATSLAVRPTSALGVPIDAAVVERMLRARLADVQSQVLRDVLTGELAALRDCAPCVDLVTTIAALSAQVMEGDARSAAVTSVSVRVGLAFAIAALPSSLAFPGRCAEEEPSGVRRVVLRANAVYEGMRQSAWLQGLGFPSGLAAAAPQGACAAMSAQVTSTLDTIGRLGTDLQSFRALSEDVDRAARSCRGAAHLGAELTAALRLDAGASGADVPLRALREIRNAFNRVRGDLSADPAGAPPAACVQSLQSLQSRFDELLGRVAADLNQDETLGGLMRQLLGIVDPASRESVVGGVTSAPEALARVDAAWESPRDGVIGHTALLRLARRVADRGIASDQRRTIVGPLRQLMTELGLVAEDRLASALRAASSCVESAPASIPTPSDAATAPRTPLATPADLDISALRRLAVELRAQRARVASSDAACVQRLDAAFAAIEVRVWSRTPVPEEPSAQEILDLLRGIPGDLSPSPDPARAITEAFRAMLPDAPGARTASTDLSNLLNALNESADFRLLRDLVQRLANRQPLRRGDVIAMAGRVRHHLDARLDELASSNARWRLVQRLVDVVLEAVPASLIEDDNAPGGLRVDVAALVSALTSEFAQQDREGLYVRATVGAGYVVTAGGDVATPFYEEIGVGYRWAVWNHRMLVGPHAAASGLLYQIQSIGRFNAPVFVGVGFSVNLYRLLDVSANVGALFDVAPNAASPSFGFSIGLQLPLTDYISAIASGTGSNTTTTARGSATP